LRRLSGRRMSAFWAKGDFMPRLTAHPLGADAPTDPSLATCGHCDAAGRATSACLLHLPQTTF
jgi:hypothetical protein